MIIYNVLQCYVDNWHSPESPLAENNGGEGALQVLRQSIKNGHFKRQDNRQMFSGVL